MNERGRNESDISRYTDVEYSPEGYKTVYRWGDFLEIAGGHVYNAMDTIDLVSTGGEYEGFNPRYAYTCEFVGCSTLVDGIALFRPVSRDGEDLTQIAFLRSDIDDDTGAYTERFEAGSFDIAAASDIQCSDLGIDLLDYFRGRSFEGLSGVKRGLDGREAILLDDEYYRLLVENRASASGVAVLSVEGLIPFKAKAWLDLSARRAGGQAVDEKSVEKHRNDVCRLATLLAGGERPAMSEGVRADMRRFLEAYESDPVDPKALKIKGVGAQQVVEVLKSVYLR